jgi:hypothetical protein
MNPAAAYLEKTMHEAAWLAFCERENIDPEDTYNTLHAPLYGEGEGYEHGNATYAVLDDSEADVAWDAALESYLDDCVEGSDGPYFDRKAWKRDARHDGRGHCLSSYDGNEYEIQVDGAWFYIYRIG